MSKKKKKKTQQKKSFLKIVKNYAAVITIGMSILAFIVNGIIKYHTKISSTEFYVQYLSVQIKTKDFVKEYQQENYGGFYHDSLQSPTLNNELNQLLYKNSDQVVGYFVTYLIIEQLSDIEAQDVELHFKQYNSKGSLSKNKFNQLPINQNASKTISQKISYPFPKGERLKIPVSICKNQNSYTMDLDECYYLKLDPISIEYKNKYPFSKRNELIRDYAETNVIIDGEVISGKGSA